MRAVRSQVARSVCVRAPALPALPCPIPALDKLEGSIHPHACCVARFEPLLLGLLLRPAICPVCALAPTQSITQSTPQSATCLCSQPVQHASVPLLKEMLLALDLARVAGNAADRRAADRLQRRLLHDDLKESGLLPVRARMASALGGVQRRKRTYVAEQAAAGQGWGTDEVACRWGAAAWLEGGQHAPALGTQR